MWISRIFLDHPHSIGETYGQHFASAEKIGWRLIAAGGACIVHSVFPYLFVTTASAEIRRLNAFLSARHPQKSIASGLAKAIEI